MYIPFFQKDSDLIAFDNHIIIERIRWAERQSTSSIMSTARPDWVREIGKHEVVTDDLRLVIIRLDSGRIRFLHKLNRLWNGLGRASRLRAT